MNDTNPGAVDPVERNALQARLQQVLVRAAADPLVPGAMAAVLIPSLGVHWLGAAGTEHLQGGSALTPGRPFRMASVSKIYVAAAVLRLVEMQRLGLESPVASCVGHPTLQLLTRAGFDPARLTLSHLLSHTSGIPDHASASAYYEQVMHEPQRSWTRHEQVELGLGLLAGPVVPGTAFQYSDTAYVILGEVIERATGQNLGRAVRDLLNHAALGLQHTHWERLEPPSAGLPPCAPQYVADLDATGFDPSLDLHGGGGLVSTVEEMALFVRALTLGQVFDKPATLAAGLLVPPAAREAGAAVHSRLLATINLGRHLGWGHFGFWGCGSACNAEHDVSLALSINQAAPQQPDLLMTTMSELGRVALAAATREEFA